MSTTAIYLRVSTLDKGQDTEMQLREIKQFLGDKPFVVYEDKGYSGTSADRPALKRLLRDCKAGKISQIVCYKLDRFFRSIRHLMNTLNELETLKVGFVAIKDGIDLTTATGRLLMQIMASFAEFEAATIRERVLSGIANARAKGIKIGRPVSPRAHIIPELVGKGMTPRQISIQLQMPIRTVLRHYKKATL